MAYQVIEQMAFLCDIWVVWGLGRNGYDFSGSLLVRIDVILG